MPLASCYRSEPVFALLLCLGGLVSPLAGQAREVELVRTAFTVPVTYTQPLGATQFIGVHDRGDAARATGLNVEHGVVPRLQLGVGVAAEDRPGTKTTWSGPSFEARYDLLKRMEPVQLTLTWGTTEFDAYEANAVGGFWIGPGQLHVSASVSGDQPVPGSVLEVGAAAIVPVGPRLRLLLEAARETETGGAHRLVAGAVVLAPLDLQVGLAVGFEPGGVERLHLVVTYETIFFGERSVRLQPAE